MIEEIRIPIVLDIVVRINVKREGESQWTPITVSTDIPTKYPIPQSSRENKKIRKILEKGDPSKYTGTSVICDFPGCGKVCKSPQNLAKHKSWHDPERKKKTRWSKSVKTIITPKIPVPKKLGPLPQIVVKSEEPVIDFSTYRPAQIVTPESAPDPRPVHEPNSHEPKPKNFGKDVDVIDCPNPKCLYKRRFIKGMGYMANGQEWCCKHCFDEFVPLAPKEVV